MGLPQSNYTQIPNEILDRLDELKCSELKIALTICRQTIGYHRIQKKLSLADLIRLTGLSKQSVASATQSLLERGWIKRTPNDDSYDYEIDVESSLKIRQEVVKNLDPPSLKIRQEVVKNLDPPSLKIRQEVVKNLDPLLINKDLNKKDLNKAFKESAHARDFDRNSTFSNPTPEPSNPTIPVNPSPYSQEPVTEFSALERANLPARRENDSQFDSRLAGGDLLDSLMADVPSGEVHPAVAMEARFRAGADGYPWKRDRALLSGFLEYLTNTYGRSGESKERSRNIAVRMVDKASFAPIQSQEYQRIHQSWLLFLDNAKQARTVEEATGQFSRLTPYAQEMRAKRQREREERNRTREVQQVC